MTAQHDATAQLHLNYWAEEPCLHRWGHIAIPLSNNRIAVHGGYGREGKKLRRLDDVVIVSKGTVTPADASPRPKARERHGAAPMKGGTAFLMHGGRAGDAFGDVWRWDDPGAWTELHCEGAAPAPRWAHAFVALAANAFLVTGGRGDAGDLPDDAHVLDTASMAWSRVAPPAFLVAFACATSDVSIVAFGGGRASCFADRTWRELALDEEAAAASRRLAPCVSATARPGELVIAGGVPAEEGEVGGVSVFRIGGDAVTCVAEAPLDLLRAYPVHAAAARCGDGFVVFGGGAPCLSFAPVFGDCVSIAYESDGART